MRVEALGYYLEILQAGSFRGAAEKLFISQQGLSKAIQNLETEMGFSLFARDSRGAQLTEAGKHIEPFVREIVACQTRLTDELTLMHREHSKTAQETIHLLATPLVTTRLLSPLHDYLNAYGLASLSVKEASFSKTIASLSEPNSPEVALVDIFVDELPAFMAEHPELHCETIYRTRITALGLPALLRPFNARITCAELGTLPIALYKTPMASRFIERVFAAQTANIILEVSDNSMILEALQKGEAVTLSDELSDRIIEHHQSLRSLPVAATSPTSCNFLYQAKAPLSDSSLIFMKRFKHMISEVLRAQQLPR